jgi:hypothetical protein
MAASMVGSWGVHGVAAVVGVAAAVGEGATVSDGVADSRGVAVGSAVALALPLGDSRATLVGDGVGEEPLPSAPMLSPTASAAASATIPMPNPARSRLFAFGRCIAPS